MTTTVIRLAGPAQSWGGARVSDEVFPTETVPTRSGLIGLLCAGLGLERGAVPQWVQDAKFTVRVDRRGYVETDFHTTNPMPDHLAEHLGRLERAAGRRSKPDPITGFVPTGSGEAWKIGGSPSTAISRRKFLSFAEFLVAITVADDHHDELVAALRTPQFCTFLGRKAFGPTFPFFLGTTPVDDHTAVLSSIPTIHTPDKTDTPTPETVTRFAHPITGLRNPTREPLTVPFVTSRKDQLAWLQHSLTR